MKTLIKWPGGKRDEVDRIKEFVPGDFDRYIEPFFGGGAVFFELKPTPAVLNDLSTELMDFYRFIAGDRDRAAFKHHMYAYVDHWERLGEISDALADDVLAAYEGYSRGERSTDEFERALSRILAEHDDVLEPVDPGVVIDKHRWRETVEERLTAKLKRTSDTVDQANEFSEADLIKNIETGIRGGSYTHFRWVMNRAKLGDIQIARAKEIANYFFVREFCYGSMFRYNSRGEFNIPYGGIAYNDKDLRRKVDRIFSGEVHELLSEAELYSRDFEAALAACEPDAEDFVFLDPPYDTEFSGYEGEAFDEGDHRRLAEWVRECSARFVLVIQNSELIQSLYGDLDDVEIVSFDKQYQYNVKDRNDRDVEHLLIHNVEAGQRTLTNYLGTDSE